MIDATQTDKLKSLLRTKMEICEAIIELDCKGSPVSGPFSIDSCRAVAEVLRQTLEMIDQAEEKTLGSLHLTEG